MLKIVTLCLVLILFASSASARLIDRDPPQQLALTDLVDANNSRYPDGRQRSRFPKPDKKLRVAPSSRRDPLSVLYSSEHSFIYTVQPNDSLGKIARQHGTTIEFIKARNKLTGNHLKAGQKLSLWNLPFNIEVDKTFNRLYLRAGDILIKEYPVSTGKSTAQTPVGTFMVKTRYPYPTWFHKGNIVPGGAADNFLGTRWLGFDKPQFGIHGTIFPELIGQSVSGGCVRMKNEDVEELYELIPIGTIVRITQM